MADYGVLAAIKKLISSDDGIIHQGLGGKVHLAIPPKASPPFVILELEEIWTSLKLGKDCGHARLKLKASVVGEAPTSRDSIYCADKIRRAMDGKTIFVDEEMRATIKLSNSIIDLPIKTSNKTVQQYYDILVRG